LKVIFKDIKVIKTIMEIFKDIKYFNDLYDDIDNTLYENNSNLQDNSNNYLDDKKSDYKYDFSRLSNKKDEDKKDEDNYYEDNYYEDNYYNEIINENNNYPINTKISYFSKYFKCMVKGKIIEISHIYNDYGVELYEINKEICKGNKKIDFIEMNYELIILEIPNLIIPQ
jgi:hypothetical protein